MVSLAYCHTLEFINARLGLFLVRLNSSRTMCVQIFQLPVSIAEMCGRLDRVASHGAASISSTMLIVGEIINTILRMLKATAGTTSVIAR